MSTQEEGNKLTKLAGEHNFICGGLNNLKLAIEDFNSEEDQETAIKLFRELHEACINNGGKCDPDQMEEIYNTSKFNNNPILGNIFLQEVLKKYSYPVSKNEGSDGDKCKPSFGMF